MAENKKTFIVTGGNSGLGLECARNIAKESNDYQLILACRNEKKAEEAVNKLVSETNNPNICAMELDLSSLASVRSLAWQYLQQGLPPLDGLVCNAGINSGNISVTDDGFECVFQTNHLGHFLLANLLLPHMNGSGHIMVVSSDMHCPPGGELTWPGVEEIAHPAEPNRRAYSLSKLCNLYFTYELDRRLRRIGSTLTINALNPGLMTETNFMPSMPKIARAATKKMFSDRVGSLEKSSKALAELMTEPIYEQVSGKYYDRGTQPKESSPLSYNPENALELWEKSIQYTGLVSGEMLPGL